MSNSKKTFALILTGLMTASMLTACGSDGDTNTGGDDAQGNGKTVELTFANVQSQGAKDAGEKFIEIVEEKTNGGITVKHFPDNQLGDDRVVVETTQFGDIDISASSTSPLCTMYPDLYIFDAPYLFLNKDQANAGMDGPVGQKILDEMSSIGLKGCALWENGFRHLTNDKIAVRVPSDVKGMKIRTMENEIHLAAWQAWGANPTPMAFTEVFTALQQGTIDGQENPFAMIDANKLYEIQHYVSMTGHIYTPYIVVMNLDRYNSFSDEYRQILDDAWAESVPYNKSQMQKYEDEIIQKFKDYGTEIIELTDDEKAQWQKAAEDAGVFDLTKSKMDHPEYMDEMLAQFES